MSHLSTYAAACAAYAAVGADVEAALSRLSRVPLSLPCWQGDDVRGFENRTARPDGGLAVTGSYPGRARNAAELRRDLEQALALIPGRHRVNLHAIYGEFGGNRVERDDVRPEHFAGWQDWAADCGIGLDFNPTLFAHPRAASGFTLSHPDPTVRAFWVEHVQCLRRIAAHVGTALGRPALTNLWIPDGMKDIPVDRAGFRRRLKEALDDIYSVHYEESEQRDSVEAKLFGIGSESFVVGSHEFYLAYTLHQGLIPCLDLGHFHPTESVADKLSALLLFVPELVLHVSRGVRWDSDHVVVFDDIVREVMLEVVRNDGLERVHLALDCFDASINRIAAWVIGARAVLKALLQALLEPTARLTGLELAGDYTGRLALLEEIRLLPLGIIWNEYCRRGGVPLDREWPAVVRQYEQEVLAARG